MTSRTRDAIMTLMLPTRLKRSRLFKRSVAAISTQRATEIFGDVAPHLKTDDRIIDIGAGACVVAQFLRSHGFNVTPLDVTDHSVIDDLRPIIYDGKRIPADDGEYDVALLVTVLHHVKDPDALLMEAARVARRVIVQEDLYQNGRQKLLTFAMDSLTNLEFFGHPHSNRDDRGWHHTFARLGLKLEQEKHKTFWRYFHSATYVLSR